MQQKQYRVPPVYDDSPIARLYQQHAFSIMTYVRRHVSSREDAEDIVLEVFVAALEQDGLVHIDEREQLAWLRGVAHHKLVDYHRRNAHRTSVPLEHADEILFTDERHDPEQQAMRNEEDALLHIRLTQLPEHYQTILQLRFANGLRCTEIARRLNKSDGAIRMLLARALNILRDIYTSSK